MQIIQLAQGLRSLLGIQGGNASPSDLSSMAVPVVDCRELYELNQIETIVTNQVVGAAIGSANFTTQVPAGEIWRVHQYYVACLLAATETINYQAAISFQTFTFPVGDRESSVTAGDFLKARAAQPFYAPAGATFAFHISNAANGPDLQGAIFFTRMKV